MTFTRNQFFILTFLVLLGPFIVYKVFWLLGSEKTTGKVWFTGGTVLELNAGISQHLVIVFVAGKDSITMTAEPSPDLKEGDPVAVRYQKSDPRDARIDNFERIWGDTIVFGLSPLIILLIIYFMPENLDPLIPRRASVRINCKNFIQIVRP